MAMKMKKLAALALASLILAALASCAGTPYGTPSASEPAPTPAQSEPAPPEAWAPEDFPRLDGSTATIPLAEALAAAFLGIDRADASRYAEFSGTSGAFTALMYGGTADLLLAYEPPAETLREATEQTEMTAIGRDALVFLVNASNPVESLTSEQIKKIYAGEITNWKDVGGEDMEIVPFQRNYSSGSQTLMTKLVMGETPMAEPPSDYVIGEMGGLVDTIASYDNGRAAIGYNVYYYVSRMKLDENVKLLPVDGVSPSNDTIGRGEYPFVNDFFAVIRRDEPEDSPARLVYDWMRGEQGRLLLEREGYIPAG